MTVVQEHPVAYGHAIWPAELCELARIRAQVRRWLGSCDLTQDLVQDLVLAVSEAAGNAVEHAYRRVTAASTVELTLLVNRGAIDIEIVDHGRWRPPAAHDTGRGRGIPLIQQLVDSVIINISTAGTQVLLHHRVAARSGENHPPTGGVDCDEGLAEAQ